MSVEKTGISLLIGILVFLGCDDNSSSFSIDRSSGYFPLNTGNTWTYKSQSGENDFEMTISIEEKIAINGKDYFVVSNLSSDSDTIRMADQTIWTFKNNKEMMLFNFNAGDNTEYQFQSMNVTVNKGVTTEVRDREFSNCISFFFDDPAIADEERGYIFAKGVGIIRMPGAWFNLTLASHTLVH